MQASLEMNKPQNPIKLDDIRQIVADDMAAVDAVIRARLASDVALINQISEYIIGAGGKRLRPILVLLAGGHFSANQAKTRELAAVIEFIHTATLLHDDVVDESDLRRGRKTANAIFGNAASVLVGDFLYSRAFQMMVDVGAMRVMEVMAEATNIIAEGEVLQLLNIGDPDTDEESYLRVVRYKTAKLFEAATRVGAILGDATPAEEDALARYGMHLGTAFQIIDDVLDYSGDAGETGKNVGDDLAEGKPTLPLIYALSHGSAAQAATIRHAIENGGEAEIADVLAAISASGAIEYARSAAKRETELAIQAISGLADSPHQGALLQLAVFAVERRF
jgi:octaprenyl-diphosphate synthase